jgi:hypothetical protein
MASGALDSGGQFVVAGQGFPGILLGSQALRWMMPETVVRDVASRHRLYLVVKPSHVGVDVDGLAYPSTVLWSTTVRRGDRASY